MKKWLTIGILGLGILTTVGSCTMSYLNGTATATTAADATTKVVQDAQKIKDAYTTAETSASAESAGETNKNN